MEGKRFGETFIQFEDPHGLSLELIETPTVRPDIRHGSHSKSAANRILGLYSATALLKSLEETQSLLVNLMGMMLHDKEGNRYRFKMKNADAFGHFYDVVVDSQATDEQQGGGTVHHIAFRTPTDDELSFWQKFLSNNGFSVTPIRDRKYFKSIYFHEPGGVLIEIATDPPGFTVDEPYESLGRDLKLPDQYESRRTEIESQLPQLRPPDFIYNSVKPEVEVDTVSMDNML
jgi:glyoxalase family protein